MGMSDNKGLFWNSQGGDRLYDADSFEKWIQKFITTGVFAGDLEVTAGTGMVVNMAPGYVNINGKIMLFEESTELAISMADGTSPRIDTVVIERNDNNREITAKIVTGTPAAEPTPTAPVRTTTIYQLVVAQIYVAAGATSITDANITRKVDDNSVCGVITGTASNNQLSYGSEDLTPGTSELADGTFYFVYE